jgi:hypothetical protein
MSLKQIRKKVLLLGLSMAQDDHNDRFLLSRDKGKVLYVNSVFATEGGDINKQVSDLIVLHSLARMASCPEEFRELNIWKPVPFPEVKSFALRIGKFFAGHMKEFEEAAAFPWKPELNRKPTV